MSEHKLIQSSCGSVEMQTRAEFYLGDGAHPTATYAKSAQVKNFGFGRNVPGAGTALRSSGTTVQEPSDNGDVRHKGWPWLTTRAGVAPCPQETSYEMAPSRAHLKGATRQPVRSERRNDGIAALNSRKPLGSIIAEWTMLGCIVAASFVIAAHVKAQELRPGDLSPHAVYCTGAQKHINNVLKKTGMFKDAFTLSGEGARQVSQNVFNHVPPADHIIIIRQTNSGSIMVPCIWGKNGPEWAGNQSNRVEIDFVFKRDLDNPKTEISEQPKQKTQKRSAKQ